MKVYNIGSKAVVYKRSFDGMQCIHPGKFLVFGDDEGAKLIKKFDRLVSEDDYNKHVADEKKKAETVTKEQEAVAKKKAEAMTKAEKSEG